MKPVLLATASALLLSLSVHAPQGAPAADAPIWAPQTAPSPLPLLQLVPGETKTLSLRHATPGQVKSYAIPPGFDIGQVVPAVDGEKLSVTGASGGTGTVTVEATLEGGDVKYLAIPFVVEALPIVDFKFEAKPGKVPKDVFVAGSFNGWSAGPDPLVKGPDDVFRLSKALPPGTHEYKFVVDGEWTPDPANTNSNAANHGNSVIKVEGEASRSFTWTMLASAMPASGPQGAFRASLPEGKKLDADNVTVVVNNGTLAPGAWELDPTGTVVRLKVPAATWYKENQVTLLGRTTDGAVGAGSFPVVYTDAPRSPRDEVIYFPMTDRFKDGDPALNKPTDDKRVLPLANYCGGDWAGIRQKIEEGYFKELGVTTIWLAPPNKNTDKVEKESVEPGRYYTSYHGYWPTSFDETNPQFGSMEDLQKLVETAHTHGIAVLLDFVSNHVHVDHPLFKANDKLATPLILPDGTRNIRLYDAHPFTTWFDTFIPTIDYDGNPDAIPVVTDSAVAWLRNTKADGFRHDAVKHVPIKFWETLTKKLETEIGQKENRFVYQVGETISGHGTVAKFVGPDLLTGQFDFPTYFALQGVLGRGEGSMTDLAESIRAAQRYYSPASIMSPLIGNHDVARFMAYADGDIKSGLSDSEIKELAYSNQPKVDNPSSYQKIRLAFAFVTAIPGPPTLYYGDEIGMTGAGDPDNRRPMQWDGWTEDQKATKDIVGKLNHARLSSIALRRGAIQVLHESPERLVIARIAPQQTVLIALNRKPADQSLAMTLPKAWGEKFDLQPLVENGLAAKASGRSLSLDGAEYAFGIWELKPAKVD